MFKPKRAGDSIAYPHQDHNAWQLAAKAHRDSVLDGGTDSQLPSWAQYTILPIRNDSGAARARFDILGINRVVFGASADDEAFENGPVLKGITPATAAHRRGQFVILLEPADEGAIVDSLLVGVVPARVDMIVAAHWYADVTDGEAGYLTSKAQGSAKIVYAPPGTGEKVCLVKVGGTLTGMFFARITGNAEADSPAQNRWEYTFEEVAQTGAGYDGWEKPTRAITGTARNLIEDMNTNTGGVIEGNGVDPDHLNTADYTFAIMPCTTGNIVQMRVSSLGEYWFAYENGVDGVCD